MGTNNTSKYYGVSNSSGNEIDFHLLGSYLPFVSPWGMHVSNFDHEKTLNVDSGYQQKMVDWIVTGKQKQHHLKIILQLMKMR